MAAGQGVLDYITIDDFTAGIVEDFSSLSLAGTHNQSSAQDGAARYLDTYSCLAGPRGGLMPAFALDGTITTSFPQTPSRMHSGHPYKRVLATAIISPIQPVTNLTSASGSWAATYAGNPDLPDSLWVMYQYYYDFANTGTSHQICLDITNFRQYNTVISQTIDNTWNAPDNMTALSASQLRYGYGAFNMARLIQSSPGPSPAYTFPGEPQMVASWSFGMVFNTEWATLPVPANAKEYSRSAKMFGDNGSVFLDQYFLPFTIALEHQGRILVQERSYQAHDGAGGFVGDPGYLPNPSGTIGANFGAQGQVPSGGVWGYSDFNRGGVGPAQLHSHAVQFDTGDAGGGAAIAQSLSASELFIVRNKGGGSLIRGDVANPTVTRLKGIPDANGAGNIGCMTPSGFVFGTRQGVWIYPGGDVAQKLSPNLDGWFWKPSTMTRLQTPQPYGKFAYFDPYIIAPNNWCMDTRTGAWMRYFPTPDLVGAGNGGRTFAFAETSTADHFYAIQAGVGNSSTADDYNLTGAHRFKPGGSTGGQAWSWRSQPLIRSRGRRLKVREVQILAQASTTTTMAVTLYGYRDGTPTTQVLGTYTFTIPASGRPVQLSHSFNVAGGDIEVKIVTNGPATLYRISLGYQETQTAHV